MSFENENYENPDDGQLPEESNNNRTFFIAVGILGGIILLTVACLVGVYLFSQNSTATADTQNVALTETAAASNNFISSALTSTAEAIILPSATVPPTSTPVVAAATVTNTPDPNATPQSIAGVGTPAAATATVAAALTQAAIAQLTIVPTTTALPQTGLVEDVGIPGLVVMALAFIIVILMARRLRFAPSR